MNETVKLFIKLSFFVFIVPFVELTILNEINALPVYFDRSYLILGFFALFILILNYRKDSRLSYRLSFPSLFFNIFLFVYYSCFIEYRFFASEIIQILLLFLLVLSGLFCFLDRGLLKNNILVFTVLLPLSMILVIYSAINDFCWMYLCTKTCRIVHGLINFLGYKDVLLLGDYRLGNPHFKISIYSPCSGIEGISFFISAFSFFLIISEKNYLNLMFVLPGYIFGIFSMFLLNIVRISTYFIFGLTMTKNHGSEEGIKATISLFHSNVGWLLYFIGISAFIFSWVYISKRLKIV